MKIGLFMGSFNPVHVGHMIVVGYMVQQTDLDQVWMVVSPQNPFKIDDQLAPEKDRLEMVRLAIGDNEKIKASDIEFRLPKPSYTIDTLMLLRKQNPDDQFVLILGEDNLINFHKWKQHKDIIANHEVYVYKRRMEEDFHLFESYPFRMFETPYLDISATYIRQLISRGSSVQYLVPDAVFKYLKRNNFYSLKPDDAPPT